MTDLSDQEAFGDTPASAVPSAVPPYPVVNPPEGYQPTSAQSEAAWALANAGKIDPKGAPGSPGTPMIFVPGRPVPQGATIIDLGGNVRPAAKDEDGSISDEAAFGAPAAAPTGAAPAAATGSLKPDQGLGFEVGFQRPIENLSTWAFNGLGKLPYGHQIQQGEQNLDAWMNGPEPPGSTTSDLIADAAKQGRRPGAVGEFGGEALADLPLMLAFKSPILGGAASGAADTTSPNNPGQVAMDTVLGGVGGKVGDVASGMFGHLLSPTLRQPVQALMDEGVNLTPGQIMGGGAQRVEDSLTHLPFVGDAIKGAQRDSLGTFVNAGVNRALAPIGEALPDNIKPGYPAIEYADNKLGDIFEGQYPKMMAVLDDDWNNSLAGATADLADRPPAIQKQFSDAIANNVTGRASEYNFLTGDAMGAADSRLGTLARQYGRGDVDQQALSAAFRTAQGGLRDLAMRQNPTVAPTLQAAREGWANLVRVEGAAANVGAKEGVFTPSQLMQSVKAGDSSPRKSAFSQGNALMQDLASSGQQVLPSTVADSGTASRGLMTAALLGGLGGHLAEGGHGSILSPYTIGGGLALAAPYSKPGLAASRWLLAGARPAGFDVGGDAIRALHPAFAAGGAAGAPQLLANALSTPVAAGGQ